MGIGVRISSTHLSIVVEGIFRGDLCGGFRSIGHVHGELVRVDRRWSRQRVSQRIREATDHEQSAQQARLDGHLVRRRRRRTLGHWAVHVSRSLAISIHGRQTIDRRCDAARNDVRGPIDLLFFHLNNKIIQLFIKLQFGTLQKNDGIFLKK